jgi:S-adenosylmethionine-diacylglycerol 3-amino-3-carboxypropyl transferase
MQLNTNTQNFLADRVKEKIFSLIHNSNLTYTTCWEDPRVDRLALNLQKNDTVLAITSGGCNSLDYLLDSPKHIYSVDVNPQQSALLELKIAGIRELDFSIFFELFGKGRLRGFKQIYQEKLRRWLSPAPQVFWDRNGEKYFDAKRSFYFRGTSGLSVTLLNGYIKHIAKIRPHIDKLLDAKTIQEQQDIYNSAIRHTLAPFMRRLLSNDLTLWMNCVPPQQRRQVEQDFNCNIGKVYEMWIEEVITQVPIQDNYFLRASFTGEYSPSCCPEYLKHHNFEILKDTVNRISVVTNTVKGFLQQNEFTLSRFVLLDHMDWLSTYRYDELISEWQAIVDRASDNARVIFRSMLSRVDYIDPINIYLNQRQQQLGDLLTYHPELAKELNKKDRVGIYGSFYIADINKFTRL